MSNLRNYQRVVSSKGRSDHTIDEGLRAYMIGVYNNMALGLVITGIVSFLVSALATTLDPSAASVALRNGIMLTDFGVALYTSPLAYVVMFAPLGLCLFMQVRLRYLSSSALRTTFFIYAALMGLSLSSIFLHYTNKSIVQTFFICAASFGSLSLYGYVTKRDLTPLGSFMIMGVFGVMIASLVNWFLKSPAMELAISIMGLIAFAGLTAYDTQKIKESYSEGYSTDDVNRSSIMGALMLYMDFIAMFMYLLRFMGQRRD
ncbi:MAG: Bax inhibitor-1/YccA family protein [Candidatus Liberibacter ctenarytainae]|uniref:Bax inhibitor-1/YccA family protein n=1 Tax=Candidatus Liberibacter ctenarytainae TaxID=2020335 RepID=A0A937DL20_9HYPH|nr:Bax inhibitor-1/YccA family protein [Candidatus Liberibacter ctenarytainae]